MAQFTSLFKKNWTVWKRDTCCCCCQIATTVVFALIMMAIKLLAKSSEVVKDDTRYFSDPSTVMFPDVSATTTPMQVAMVYSNLIKNMAMAPPPQGRPAFSFLKNCTIWEDRKYVGGYVAMVSQDATITAALNAFFANINFKTRQFAQTADLFNEVLKDNYGQFSATDGPNAICLGITFEEQGSGKWAYSLHYNSSANPNTRDVEDPKDGPEKLFKEEGDPISGGYAKFFSSGHLVLQHMIDNMIMKIEGGATAAISTKFVRNPVKKYTDTALYSSTNNGQVDIYIIFPILVIFLGFIYHMLKEKENRITENMRNMGMSFTPHYLSWLAFYSLVLFVLAVIFTVLCKIYFFSNSNVLLIFLLYFLPGMFLISLAFFISSFFVSAKPGVLAGIIAFFLLYAVSIGKGSISEPTEAIYNAFALSPFTGLAMSGSNMVLLESINNFGFGFANAGQTITYFKYTTFIIITVLETLFIFFLGIYLDQVWPTDLGIKKHPLFCFGKKYRSSDSKVSNDSMAEVKENFEELTEEQKMVLTDSSKTIQVKNLRKVYGNGKVAVHNLNLNMFENEIFALLGHNGAGKTTTISMISGLIPQTSGTINIAGFDTVNQYEDIKKITGVCPQLNPIYENLTCKEHLELYGNLKMKPGDKVNEEEIDKILRDIDLYEKKDYPAGKLSGGQKRKLCIGIAFIGGSKVILLDEPTSGMDTFARRYLWEMLKKYKKDRIIILCTHYMDEADFLGDRFGIMGEGKLITCGSSLFLKKRFGVGYDLTVVKENSEISSAKIESLIKQRVPAAEKTGDISMEVKFRLPTDQSGLFESLFKDLEDNNKSYGIQSFGISLTTMEEVFLKVAVGIDHGVKKDGKEEMDRKAADDMAFELEDIRIKGRWDIFRIHFWALCVKRFIYFKRDVRGLICEILLPIIIVILGLSFTLIKFVNDPKPMDYTPAAAFTRYPTTEVWVNNNVLYDPIFNRLGSMNKISLMKKDGYSTPADMETALMDNRVDNRYISYFMDSTDSINKRYAYTMFYNTTVVPSVIIGTNLMNNAILKETLNNADSYIKVRYEGLRLTNQLKNFENTADGFIAVFLFALAYAFIPAGVVLFIVKEREHNSKHQQIVSGVSIYAYWFSNLFIDIIKYLVPGIFTALSILIFNVTAFTDEQNYGMTWALVLMYGPSIMAFTYLTSFLFKSPESAQIATFIFNFLAGFILMLISFVLRAVRSTRDYSPSSWELVMRLLPTYDFSWGMFQLANTQIWAIFYALPKKPLAWERWGALLDFLYMIGVSIICMLAIFYIELRTSKVDQTNKDSQALVDNNHKDEDVTKEREDVLKRDDYAIKVVDFAKEYKMLSNKGGCCDCSQKVFTSKVAVKGVTFGVEKGECFGLLGTNGAGKTTTFKALSGEILPTFGKTFIAGYDLSKDMNRVRYLIGYCPQFETLLENLTAREHLELYAAIKGIPYAMRERLVQDLLYQLNLKPFENVLAGTYSGGNKRKLSVAIALLGSPPIILLDEPSSGMDPEARRFMWSIIGKISTEKKQSTVVLTTHSMEEAEALSSKMAIMVEGKIECIGPVQKLKSKYGKGFEVEVKLNLASKDEIAKLKQKVGINHERELTSQEILAIFETAGVPELRSELRKDGKCSTIFNMIEQKGKVNQNLVLESVIISTKVKSLEAFLKNHFQSFELIESVNTFFRYKLPEGQRISKLFGELERNQVSLCLSQYSVKQTTIEQIFINFANQAEHHED